jgi:hypothetical protein
MTAPRPVAAVPAGEQVYGAPCPRPDGCRIATIDYAAGRNRPTVMTADCGWTTRVPLGADHHLTDAIGRWRDHECRERAAS